VKAIPAGGYVRIIGMSNLEEVDPADEPRTFRQGSTTRRLVVILAGVTVNLLLAFVLFFASIAGQGQVVVGPSTTVGRVVAGSAAATAGIQRGDRFVAIDGTRVASWDDLRAAIETRGNQQATFTMVRDGQTVQIDATPDEQAGKGFLGIAPTTATRSVGLLGAIPESFKAMGDTAWGTATGIGHIFSPSGVQQYSKNFTSAAPKPGSQQDLERPRSLVGIVDQGSNLVAGNIWALLWLLGAISLILALFNLLPLLPFDGGHAVVVIYEAVASKVRGRTVRVDFRKLMPVTAVVLAIFLTLGLSAMFLDIRDLTR
jgi:membrane-associated protease RseP (regulator of RpoE activity)